MNHVPSTILTFLATLLLSADGNPQSLAKQLGCDLYEQLISANVVTEAGGPCFWARS